MPDDKIELDSHLGRIKNFSGFSLAVAALGGMGSVFYYFFFGSGGFDAARGGGESRSHRGPTRVLVVGGGIIGAMSALELGKRGYDVTVLDAGKIGGDSMSSFGNAGSLGISNKPIAVNNIPGLKSVLLDWGPNKSKYVDWPAVLREKSFWMWGVCYCVALFDYEAYAFQQKLWSERIHSCQLALLSLLQAETMPSAGIRVSGKLSITVGKSEQALRLPKNLKSWPRLIHGLVGQRRLKTAEFHQEDAQGDSYQVLSGIRSICISRYGCRWLTETHVETIQSSENGLAVQCADGTVYDTDLIVVCAGSRSGDILRKVGVWAPIYPLRGYSVTAPLRDGITLGEDPPVCQFLPSLMFATAFPGNRMRFTNYGEMSSPLPDPPKERSSSANKKLWKRLEGQIRDIVPDLNEIVDMSKAHRWVGERPFTPDAHPIIGATRIPGVFINSGQSFDGWRDSVWSARILSECVDARSNEPLQREGLELVVSIERFKPFRRYRAMLGKLMRVVRVAI